MVSVDDSSLHYRRAHSPVSWLCAVLHSSCEVEPGEVWQWLCHDDSFVVYCMYRVGQIK